MSKVFTPSDVTSNQAHVSSMDSYQKQYQDSISDPESFWAEIAQRLDWMGPWTSVRHFDFVNGQKMSTSFFDGLIFVYLS